MTPIHANQLILLSVRILEQRNTMMAATATNTAVQVPCVDNALKLMEMPKIPDAERL